MRRIIIFLLLLLVLPIGLSQIFNFNIKNVSDIPNVTINQSDKNITLYGPDWGNFTSLEVIDIIDTPEELRDYTYNYLSYHAEYSWKTGVLVAWNEMHPFNYTHNLSLVNNDDTMISSISNMNGTEYGVCVLMVCSPSWHGTHLMYVYHENNTYFSFSDNSGFLSGNGLNELALNLFHNKGESIPYNSYGVICLNENQDFVNYAMTTGDDVNLWGNVTFPDCNIEITHQRNNTFSKIRISKIEINEKLIVSGHEDSAAMFTLAFDMWVWALIILIFGGGFWALYKALR